MVTQELLPFSPLPADTLAADTVVAGEARAGLVLSDPSAEAVRAFARQAAPEESYSVAGDVMSWVFLALAVLFCLSAFRFKGNSRYMRALISDLTDTRIRHNAFDDTVRETSLLTALNITWVACAGILLWQSMSVWPMAGLLPGPAVTPGAGILLCCGVCGCYLALMVCAYWSVGRVFSDARHTRLWVKGAAAATALETFLLFPAPLITLSSPQFTTEALVFSLAVFAAGKIMFLYKGFRIFFNQITSWLLFLYYLCSLEIVPLILTYLAARAACAGDIL